MNSTELIKLSNNILSAIQKQNQLLNKYLEKESLHQGVIRPKLPRIAPENVEEQGLKSVLPTISSANAKQTHLPAVNDSIIALISTDKSNFHAFSYFEGTISQIDSQKPYNLADIAFNSSELENLEKIQLNYSLLNENISLTLNTQPDPEDIGIGTKVLFKQGVFETSQLNPETDETETICLDRWHLGEITKVLKIKKSPDKKNSNKISSSLPTSSFSFGKDKTKSNTVSLCIKHEKQNSPTYTYKFFGTHVKTNTDGKFTAFRNYSQTFIDYEIKDLRLAINYFDLTEEVDKTSVRTEMEFDFTENLKKSYDKDIDIFLSFSKLNSIEYLSRNLEQKPSKQFLDVTGLSEQEAQDLDFLRDKFLDHYLDPNLIQNYLEKEIKLKVFISTEDTDVKLIQENLKKSKVYIACLSEEFTSNSNKTIEFSYAKKSLDIPIIPIIVGYNQIKWQDSVIGLLTAGELYIWFKNFNEGEEICQRKIRDVKNALINYLSSYIPELENDANYIPDVDQHTNSSNQQEKNLKTTQNIPQSYKNFTGPSQIFISYAWKNSIDALNKMEITPDQYVGSPKSSAQYADPRYIAASLQNFYNSTYNQNLDQGIELDPDDVEEDREDPIDVWLDINKLSSTKNFSMFQQIHKSIGECDLVIICISNEYANSENCLMEAQFTLRNLHKPVIFIEVGDPETSKNWKKSVIGMLYDVNFPVVDFLSIGSSVEFFGKISEIFQLSVKFLGLKHVESTLHLGGQPEELMKQVTGVDSSGDPIQISQHVHELKESLKKVTQELEQEETEELDQQVTDLDDILEAEKEEISEMQEESDDPSDDDSSLAEEADLSISEIGGMDPEQNQSDDVSEIFPKSNSQDTFSHFRFKSRGSEIKPARNFKVAEKPKPVPVVSKLSKVSPAPPPPPPAPIGFGSPPPAPPLPTGATFAPVINQTGGGKSNGLPPPPPPAPPKDTDLRSQLKPVGFFDLPEAKKEKKAPKKKKKVQKQQDTFFDDDQSLSEQSSVKNENVRGRNLGKNEWYKTTAKSRGRKKFNQQTLKSSETIAIVQTKSNDKISSKKLHWQDSSIITPLPAGQIPPPPPALPPPPPVILNWREYNKIENPPPPQNQFRKDYVTARNM